MAEHEDASRQQAIARERSSATTRLCLLVNDMIGGREEEEEGDL